MNRISFRSLTLIGALASLLASRKDGWAQASALPNPQRQAFESRTELETQAKAAETQHRTGEAFLLRQRLKNGDFQDGDRIVWQVQGNSLMPNGFAGVPETLTVRAGKRIELPRMADMPLEGVLRSELNDRLTQHIAEYLKEPTVRSTPLLRVAVLGVVGRPGYLYTQADSPLSDVIMQAGGLSSDANMDGITIKRGSDVIWDAQDTRAALADGMSLDRLHLRAGDEIYIPKESHFPWLTVISFGMSAAALLYGFTRR